MAVKLIIADDSPDIVKYLEFIFKRQNFEVHTARHGQAAVELAQAVFPDVVLLDTMMPVMDGLEACRLLRDMPFMADKPIVMYSALVGSEVRDEAIAAGATDFLGKAIGHDALVERVRELLATTSGPAGFGPESLVATALDIIELLQVELAWLLAVDADKQNVMHIAAASELGEQSALRFVQSAGKGPFKAQAGNPFGDAFEGGPQLDISAASLTTIPGGEGLAKALRQIGAPSACLVPAQLDGVVYGLVVYPSPRTIEATPQYRRAISTIARYAALALAKHASG